MNQPELLHELIKCMLRDMAGLPAADLFASGSLDPAGKLQGILVYATGDAAGEMLRRLPPMRGVKVSECTPEEFRAEGVKQ